MLNSFSSYNDIAFIEIPPQNNQANILIYEIKDNHFKHNENSIVDMVNVQSNTNFSYTLKFDLDKIEEEKYDNIRDLNIFTISNNGSIETFETFYDSEFLYSIIDKFGRFGVLNAPSQSDGVELPSEIELLSCYPNPFNPFLTITYLIKESSNTLIEIYDLNGRKVKLLTNGSHEKGIYNVIWDASLFSSGVYFITMAHENGVETKKVTLVK